MPAPSPAEDASSLIPGMTRRALAEKMGESEATIQRMELKFKIRLCIALHADPATRHLVPSSFLRYIPENPPT